MRAELVGLATELRTLGRPQEHFAERLEQILAAHPEDEINDLRTRVSELEGEIKQRREAMDAQTIAINNLKHALAAAEQADKPNADDPNATNDPNASGESGDRG